MGTPRRDDRRNLLIMVAMSGSEAIFSIYCMAIGNETDPDEIFLK
jgi:hypothetical protein